MTLIAEHNTTDSHSHAIREKPKAHKQQQCRHQSPVASRHSLSVELITKVPQKHRTQYIMTPLSVTVAAVTLAMCVLGASGFLTPLKPRTFSRMTYCSLAPVSDLPSLAEVRTQIGLLLHSGFSSYYLLMRPSHTNGIFTAGWNSSRPTHS